MRSIIKKVLPNWVIQVVRNRRLRREFIQDYKKYVKYSSFKGDYSETKMKYRLIVLYHAIEKGLSTINPRLGFGKSHISEMVDIIKDYNLKNYDKSDTAYIGAISTLHNYIDFHNKSNYNLDNLKEILKPYLNENKHSSTLIIHKNQVQKCANMNYADFFKSRHSVRNYSNEPVSINVVIDAIELAKNAPSACNRQSSRVYIIEKNEYKSVVSKLHRGSRSFSDKVDKFLVVTSSYEAFFDSAERYQYYIDGGIFVMSLVNALHYKGIANCILNWSVNNDLDLALKKDLNIPMSEVVVALVSIGNYPEQVSVTASQKREVTDLVTIR